MLLHFRFPEQTGSMSNWTQYQNFKWGICVKRGYIEYIFQKETTYREKSTCCFLVKIGLIILNTTILRLNN